MRFLLSIVISLNCITLFGQQRMTVTDPEIEFSYELPTRWQRYDDGYNLILIPPTRNEDEYLSITYFESDDLELDLQFNFTVKQLLPLNEPGFKLMEQGEDNLRDIEARWATFETTFQGTTYGNLLFFFIENGQTFKLRGTSRIENFDDYRNNYLQIMKSIESKAL